MRNYQLYHSKDSWGLAVQDSRPLGMALEWLLDHTCMEWWGKCKNIPFCWINPWGWTFKVGTEDHNLGGLWYSVANRLYTFAWHCRRDVKVVDILLTPDQAKLIAPDFYTDFKFLDEDDE